MSFFTFWWGPATALPARRRHSPSQRSSVDSKSASLFLPPVPPLLRSGPPPAHSAPPPAAGCCCVSAARLSPLFCRRRSSRGHVLLFRSADTRAHPRRSGHRGARAAAGDVRQRRGTRSGARILRKVPWGGADRAGRLMAAAGGGSVGHTEGGRSSQGGGGRWKGGGGGDYYWRAAEVWAVEAPAARAHSRRRRRQLRADCCCCGRAMTRVDSIPWWTSLLLRRRPTVEQGSQRAQRGGRGGIGPPLRRSSGRCFRRACRRNGGGTCLRTIATSPRNRGITGGRPSPPCALLYRTR